jgi:predicted acetyltransferase
MPNTVIRQLKGEQVLQAMYWLPSYAFGPSPPLPDEEKRREILKSRTGVTYIGLLKDDKIQSVAASTRMTQQVRGKMYKAGAIWGVVTHPQARQQGHSRQVLQQLFAAIRQQGNALSCLYPFRETFYERLGYVTFPRPLIAQFSPEALLPLAKQEIEGEVELALIGEGIDEYLNLVNMLHPRIHGMGVFDDEDALRFSAERNRLWLALARVDGELVGLMAYELKGGEVTDFELRAIRFYYTTAQGKFLLLQWIARHAGQAEKAEVWLPPYEQPETWLPDMRISFKSVERSPMGRVLDVRRLSGMDTGAGSFSAQISDATCPWNEGIWLFQTVDDKLTVRSAKTPDCELSIHALAALIYGTHDPADFAFRGWGAPRPAIQATMRTMFPPMAPYLHEWF